MAQINKIRNEKGDITTNTNKLQRIIREHTENLHSSALEDIGGIHKFLEQCDLPKLYQDNINHLNQLYSEQ
jgi:RNA-binding protein YlmH